VERIVTLRSIDSIRNRIFAKYFLLLKEFCCGVIYFYFQMIVKDSRGRGGGGGGGGREGGGQKKTEVEDIAARERARAQEEGHGYIYNVVQTTIASMGERESGKAGAPDTECMWLEKKRKRKSVREPVTFAHAEDVVACACADPQPQCSQRAAQVVATDVRKSINNLFAHLLHCGDERAPGDKRTASRSPGPLRLQQQQYLGAIIVEGLLAAGTIRFLHGENMCFLFMQERCWWCRSVPLDPSTVLPSRHRPDKAFQLQGWTGTFDWGEGGMGEENGE
jgi:hypothetical protein